MTPRERAHAAGPWYDPDGSYCNGSSCSYACNAITEAIRAAVDEALSEAATDLRRYADSMPGVGDYKNGILDSNDRITALRSKP